MLRHKVEKTMEQSHPELIVRGCDGELMDATDLGVVQVNLSGECWAGRLQHLLTTLDIVATVKKLVPGDKIVMEGKHAEASS